MEEACPCRSGREGEDLADRGGDVGVGDADAEVDARPENDPVRVAVLTRALALLREQPGGRRAKDLHDEALIHEALGQPGEALDAYRAALARDPRRADWRYEFARLLRRQGRRLPMTDRDEASDALAFEPGHELEMPSSKLCRVEPQLDRDARITWRGVAWLCAEAHAPTNVRNSATNPAVAGRPSDENPPIANAVAIPGIIWPNPPIVKMARECAFS